MGNFENLTRLTMRTSDLPKDQDQENEEMDTPIDRERDPIPHPVSRVQSRDSYSNDEE